MQMTFRWFGDTKDTVSLEQIRQIPGVKGVVPALHTLPAGEAWPLDMITDMKREIEAAGLTMECIESVNVHEDIKLGNENADRYIDNYIESIRNLGKAGVRVICYNFMPVFDWTRTDLAMDMGNGATCLSYNGKQIEGKSPEDMFREIDENSNGYAMPGWETERMGEIKELFKKYKGVTEDDLVENLRHFLRRIAPVCEDCGVKMAIHPDDPPWGIFGLPRIIKNTADLERLLSLVDSDINGITFCTGSLGAGRENDLPALAREFADRICFAHLRQIRFEGERDFCECGHRTDAGSLDMLAIVEALVDGGFDGYVRPDHGRNIWGEDGKPGYGLYDRALGACYLSGLFEAVERRGKR